MRYAQGNKRLHEVPKTRLGRLTKMSRERKSRLSTKVGEEKAT
jgi:hypothetical protein